MPALAKAMPTAATVAADHTTTDRVVNLGKVGWRFLSTRV
jgi:hypothetical protein